MPTGEIHDRVFSMSDSSVFTRRQFLLASSLATLSACVQPTWGAAEEEGFVPLFNGRNIEGWHLPAKKIEHGTGGQWQVENGVLTGQQDPPGSGNGGMLLSDGKFGDFELLIDMNPDWGPDTGVFFRCTEEGAGFQMYVDYHNGGNVGHLRGEMPGAFAMKPYQIHPVTDVQGGLTGFTTGPDPRTEKWPKGVYAYTCTPEQWLAAWRVGQWNTARIRCVGRHPQITTWINGLKVCHWDAQTCTLPGYDKDHVLKLLGTSGMIGLQIHRGPGAWPKGTKCRWRNIRIKTL
jgi:hypothetical protein